MVLINLMTVLRQNDNLFSQFALPVGMDKQNVIDNIIMETMELSLIYSEPKTLEYMIGVWSRKKLYNWNELYKTLSYKYDPISNYNRTEEWVDRTDKENSAQHVDRFKNKGDKAGDDTRTPNLQEVIDGNANKSSNGSTDITTNTTENVDGTTDNDTTHKVWGFNESDAANAWNDISKGKNHQTTESNGTSNETREDSSQETSKQTRKNTGAEKTDWKENYNDSGDGSYEDAGQEINFSAHKGKIYGNIGVTTTQQMIEAQRKVVEYNIIDTIIADFKRQFCLMIY